MSASRTDIAFVNPGGRAAIYQALGNELTAIEPPIWSGLLASAARARGAQVQVIDAEALGWTPEDVARAVESEAPRLCVVVAYGHQPSASTQTMTAASATLRALRQSAPGVPLAIVGGHVSALPERTLREEAVDYVIQGEGPHTLEALLPALEKGNLADVPGLWYWEGEEVRHTAPAPLIRDLDRELGGIAWDLLPMERYRAHNWHCFGEPSRTPYASLYTSLGCPFSCGFCCINAPFGKPRIRYFSPDQVIGELDVLVQRYGVRHVKIADEMFVLNPRHVEGICDRVLERGYDLNFWAYARIDTVRVSQLEKLRAAGFRWLALGIESGSEHVRDGADKSFSQSDIVKTVRAIQDAGIHVIGNYIFGLPDDDLESMQQTMGLAVELNCEFANFYTAMAYPGSPLYGTALEKGWNLPERWSGFSQHAVDTLPLPTRALSAGEVLQFRDDCFHAYFSSARYLDLVEREFGPETRAHVEQITRIRLERSVA